MIVKRIDSCRKDRAAAQAALNDAKQMDDGSFERYRVLRLGEEAHTRAVVREDYQAVLLRRHPDQEALERTLESAINDAFAEALRKLDEAEKPIRDGRLSFGL